jgi:hypothetical protein
MWCQVHDDNETATPRLEERWRFGAPQVTIPSGAWRDYALQRGSATQFLLTRVQLLRTESPPRISFRPGTRLGRKMKRISGTSREPSIVFDDSTLDTIQTVKAHLTRSFLIGYIRPMHSLSALSLWQMADKTVISDTCRSRPFRVVCPKSRLMRWSAT